MKKVLGVFCGMVALAFAFTGIKAKAAETMEIEVTYCQSMARDVLTYINAFRANTEGVGSPNGAWVWNQSNSQKIDLTGKRAPLKYDYGLEKAAMQRAAEIAVKFGHTRPNGTIYATAFNGILSCNNTAENIASGAKDAGSVVNSAWKEGNDLYAGQQHRRSMLSATYAYTCVGVACVKYNGNYYWVAEYSSKGSGYGETEALNGISKVTIPLLSQKSTQPQQTAPATQPQPPATQPQPPATQPQQPADLPTETQTDAQESTKETETEEEETTQEQESYAGNIRKSAEEYFFEGNQIEDFVEIENPAEDESEANRLKTGKAVMVFTGVSGVLIIACIVWAGIILKKRMKK